MKLSETVALSAWLSVLALAWIIVLRVIPSDALAWFLWAFFLVLAVLASLVAASNRPLPTPTKIKEK